MIIVITHCASLAKWHFPANNALNETFIVRSFSTPGKVEEGEYIVGGDGRGRRYEIST